MDAPDMRQVGEWLVGSHDTYMTMDLLQMRIGKRRVGERGDMSRESV